MSPAEQPEKYYTKDEVNMLLQAAVAEAHEMDRKIMAKHIVMLQLLVPS